MSDSHDSHDRLVVGTNGVKKPLTVDGWHNPADPLCELCTFATTASYHVEDYEDGEGVDVCGTHAKALGNGVWDGEDYDVVPLEERPAVELDPETVDELRTVLKWATEQISDGADGPLEEIRTVYYTVREEQRDDERPRSFSGP